MKKLILLLAALMTLTASCACAKTISPLPARIDPDAVANQAVSVRLLEIDWRAQTVTVALCEPEAFACEDILSLQAGDVLRSRDGDIRVVSIESDQPTIRINPDEDALTLTENANGDFESMLYERKVYRAVAERTFALADDLVFLDGIDPSSGEALDMPTAHTPEELSAILAGTSYGPGFMADNTYMVFNDDQEALVLGRFYVPWQ